MNQRQVVEGSALPSRAVRSGGRVLLLVLLSAWLVLVGDPRPAAAAAVPGVPAGLPYSLAGAAAIASAEGIVTAYGASLAAAAAPAAIAAAPVLIAGAAAAATVGGVYLLWNWKTGHATSYADPTGNPQTFAGGWSTQGTCSGATCSGTFRTGTFSGTVKAQHGLAKNGYAVGVDKLTCFNSCQNLAQNTTYSVSSSVDNPGTTSGMCIGVQYNGGGPYTWVASIGSPASGPCLATFTGSTVAPTVTAGPPATGTQPVVTTPTSSCYNGTTTTSVTGPTITYSGGTTNAALPLILVPACPAGYQRIGFTTPTTGYGGAAVTSPMSWTAPTIPVEYANCQPGGSSAPCALTLTRTSPSGEVTNCTNNVLCDSPNLTGEPDGSTYTCKWGPYVLAPSECTTVPTNGTPPATPTAEPCTGAAVGTLGCAPATGQVTGDCVFAWVFDPRDWVIEPLKCLFVPSSETLTQFTTARDVGEVVPFSYIGDIVTWLETAFGGATGHCLDWGVSVGPFGQVGLLDTCTPGPMEGILMGKRTLLGVVLYVSLLAPLAWWAWRAYAPASTGVA